MFDDWWILLSIVSSPLIVHRDYKKNYTLVHNFVKYYCYSRSSTQHFLSVPFCNTVLGKHHFSVAAPLVWNNLPLDLRTANSDITTRRRVWLPCMTVSVFCKIMSVRDRLLARILYSGHNVHRCTELLYVLLQILKLFGDILTFILVFSMVFITPITPAVYSRDHLLSLRSHVIQLNLDQRALIVQLGLSRRGSRAGSHLRRRLQAAASVTSAISRTSQPGEIPTIIGHRVVFINNNQLIDQRCVSIRIAEQR